MIHQLPKDVRREVIAALDKVKQEDHARQPECGLQDDRAIFQCQMCDTKVCKHHKKRCCGCFRIMCNVHRIPCPDCEVMVCNECVKICVRCQRHACDCCIGYKYLEDELLCMYCYDYECEIQQDWLDHIGSYLEDLSDDEFVPE